MNVIAPVKALASALATWLHRRHARRTVHVVDQVPLFGGTVVHVLDVEAHRLVIATSQRAICLLAQFDRVHHGAPLERPQGEEAPRQSVDIM